MCVCLVDYITYNHTYLSGSMCLSANVSVHVLLCLSSDVCFCVIVHVSMNLCAKHRGIFINIVRFITGLPISVSVWMSLIVCPTLSII